MASTAVKTYPRSKENTPTRRTIGGLTVSVSRCPVCEGRLMYRTRITIDQYAVSSAWVCPVCEQEKTAPELEVANG